MPNTIQETLSTISERLKRFSDTPSLDAQVLVAHFVGKPRAWVMAHPEYKLQDRQIDLINQALQRLESGEPLPYVIGHWEFYGLDFDLTPDVLIPRPETELLVERGLAWLKNHPDARSAIDVGTGSGCIGIALAIDTPHLHVLMTDISPSALGVAMRNAHKFGLSDRLEFQAADLFDGVEATFDLICANLPYIPTRTLKELPVAKSEPSLALDGGAQGTDCVFKLLDQSPQHLSLGGLLLMEIEASQGSGVKSYAQSLYPASKIHILKDYSEKDRCLQIERSAWIVHLCQKSEWLDAQKQGRFVDASLERDGFIHCSTPEQILYVANHFYRELPQPVLLWIDPGKLASEIRWEATDGELYPHIYGPINLTAVEKTTELKPDEDGVFRLTHSAN